MIILVIDDDNKGRHEAFFTDESKARAAWDRAKRKAVTWSATLWRGSVKLLDFDRGLEMEG